MDNIILGSVMPNQRLERAVMAKLVGAASAEDCCALAAPWTPRPAAAQSSPLGRRKHTLRHQPPSSEVL
jgi:hypothetical protein